jgi:hypothetical protein
MLTGTIRPLGKAALLYVGVGGQASSASIGAMERQGYTELNVVAGSSDGASGIRRLAEGGGGFLAILSPAASTR